MSKPLRMSVWPVASHTCTPLGAESSRLCLRQHRDYQLDRRGIERPHQPHPRAGRKLDLDRRRRRSRNRGHHYRRERRRGRCSTAQLLPPSERTQLRPARSRPQQSAPSRPRDHRWRRCTDVITSTCVLVIGLSLGLVVRLSAPPHIGKVALTVRVPHISISISFATSRRWPDSSAGLSSWSSIRRSRPTRSPRSSPMARPIQARSTWRRPETEPRATWPARRSAR